MLKGSSFGGISRATLIVALLMFVSGFFVARVPDATRPEYAGASSLFVVLFAVPSYVALWRWVGRRRAIKVLCALGLFAFGIETFAIATGWPYGWFTYGDKIGAKLGLVPWTVPFAWTPLVLGAWSLSGRRPIGGRMRQASRYLEWWQVWQSTLCLIAFDLVLDPGAVSQRFWTYRFPGLYYGVPVSNFGGWLLSGLIGVALLQALIGECARQTPPAGLMTSVAWIVSFWTSVCLFSFLWLPAMVGFVLLFLLGRAACASSV